MQRHPRHLWDDNTILPLLRRKFGCEFVSIRKLCKTTIKVGGQDRLFDAKKKEQEAYDKRIINSLEVKAIKDLALY